MLKTPPRLAGLGVALTMCAIGAGGALNADQVADATDQHIIRLEFQGPEFSALQIEFSPKAPELLELLELETNRGANC